MANRNLSHGAPYPLGATWIAALNGYNFSIYAKEATQVLLIFFGNANLYLPAKEYILDPFVNKTNAIWHCFIPAAGIPDVLYYAYRIDGPAEPGNRFNPAKLLLDPWAKAVFFPPDFSRAASIEPGDNTGKAVLGQLIQAEPVSPGPINQNRHEHDLVMYEMHVKGFTNDSSSGLQDGIRGTFAGITEKIPYLQELGITAVELMPVHQFDIQENNYWGYMTLNFFAPHNKYCVSKNAGEQLAEFKSMVEALHKAGIEVILDVIYNHTVEGNDKGPCYSYKGISNSSYYLLTGDLSNYVNDAGTGNVLRTSYKMVRKLILDSLRYWVQEMNVDGFRFDLATIFTRNDDASINTVNPPLLEEISMDPVLSQVRLIAEPWDMATYQLGSRFPGTSWAQWNGAYRDEVRQFIKGDNNLISSMMQRLYGSDDLFPDRLPFSRHPADSINFITAHDGFTLYDLVSYNVKHNEANGSNNEDGSDTNHSWNCGMEGDDNLTGQVLALRKKQIKNMITLLMLSNGVPMFRMGDEFMHTQKGNNNAFNQDNTISWLNWKKKDDNQDVFRFFKMIIGLRKKHPSISRYAYWRTDISWFGTGKEVDMSFTSHALAYCLKGDTVNDPDLYVIINAYWEPLQFVIQTGTAGNWRKIVDTSLESPYDIIEHSDAIPLTSLTIHAAARSCIVFESGKEK